MWQAASANQHIYQDRTNESEYYVFYNYKNHKNQSSRTNRCDVMYSLLGHPLPIATLK
jgi:hypothetical protein